MTATNNHTRHQIITQYARGNIFIASLQIFTIV